MSLVLHAPGKINLALEVLGRRPDGYHEVATVIHTVELHDLLTFRLADDVTLRCHTPGLATADNLVYQAADLLRRATGTRAGATIQLTKRLPLAAGLGGGSSDAACALRGLKRLWHLALSWEDLVELGAKLGSDVPFFLLGGAALVEGRGERITPLPPLGQQWMIIAVPPLRLPQKTARTYGQLGPSHYSDGSKARALAERLAKGQEPDESLLVNVFEAVVLEEYPEVRACRDQMVAAGAKRVHLCGSGPALYALADSRAAAQQLYHRLTGAGITTYLTRITAGEDD